MKKKILSIIALVFCVALIFTGCATVGDVKDSNGNAVYFDEAAYFGGHIAQVGDYIYYGNGYVSTTGEGFNYKNAAKIANLKRIKELNAYTFEDGVESVNFAHTSPQGIETVNEDKLIGYESQDMYALGNYLYFTSANVHKTDAMENDYTQVSIFRVKFNGDDFKEIATFKSDDSSKITLTKANDGNYYFVAIAPNGESHAIYSVKVGSSVGKVQTLVENVTSAVIADENSTEKNVIFTVDAEKDIATTTVKAVDIATGDIETLDTGLAGSATKLIDRVGDRVFYSYTNPENKVQEVYSKTINATSTNFSPTERFYNATTISDVRAAGEGYIFKTEGGALVYKTLDGTQELLMAASDFSDILFVNGEYIYLSNASSIKRVTLEDYSSSTIVSGVTMISGECGYTDEYIYFYSQLGELELDEGEESSTDENYYMYRTDLQGNIQLIGKTAKK